MFQDFTIRFMVGAVFLSEGLLKFLFSAELGEGRFARLGVPYARHTSYFVGSVEVISALMILVGFRIRAAVWPLLGVMAGALYWSKLPLLTTEGFWKAVHESRVDFCMVCGLGYLLHSYRKRGAR